MEVKLSHGGVANVVRSGARSSGNLRFEAQRTVGALTFPARSTARSAKASHSGSRISRVEDGMSRLFQRPPERHWASHQRGAISPGARHSMLVPDFSMIGCSGGEESSHGQAGTSAGSA
jgi:hypothetical protein